MLNAILIFTAAALSVLRIAGTTAPAFQASAHVFAGGLLGAWSVSRRRLYGGLALALLAVEGAMFVATLPRS